ncbi:MAG: hypothetical protein H8D22_11725 [Candidatus Cloacimonetes bacterium]|nr:hypothetical protein [Candidatus Cloacimonadota bacterium]
MINPILEQHKKGKTHFYPIFIIVGIISAFSQTILLRELMVEVNGNEIIFAIFLSLWLFLVALGTLLNKFIRIKRNLENHIYFLLSILIFIAPIQFLFIRILANKFAVISGLLLDIPSLIILALIILTPGCLLIGFLFPLNCKLIAEMKKPVHTVYILECIGMIIGGILFFILISQLNNFSLLLLGNVFSFTVLYVSFRKRVFLFCAIFFLIITVFSKVIFFHNYASRYLPNKLVSSQDSKYGRFDVSEYANQRNFYWNGVLFANSENKNYANEMVNFVLLQHQAPHKILLVGGLLNGYLDEILKDKYVEEVDYLELEKNIINQSTFYKKKEERVNFILMDAVRFLKNSQRKYDIIYIDIPDPSSIFLNRFYTIEFFQLLKSHLISGNAVVAITVSNAENFLLPELAKLNAAIFQTFSEVFAPQGGITIIPAEQNIFIGSMGTYMSNNVDKLTERMNQRNKSGVWFNQALIFDTCNQFRLDNFQNAISGEKVTINKNLNPTAYLFTIQFWAKHLDIELERFIKILKDYKILVFIFAILTILLISSVSNKIQNRKTHFVHDFNIFSVSFSAFVMQLILLYIFQMQFGYVYFVIAIFTISFMLGLTLGFLFAERINISVFILFALNLILILMIYFIAELSLPVVIYFLFNILVASFEGVILAKVLTKKYKYEQIDSGVSFYFLDTLGATFGGLLVGVIFLPVFSIRTNIIFIGSILLINIVLLKIRKIEKLKRGED